MNRTEEKTSVAAANGSNERTADVANGSNERTADVANGPNERTADAANGANKKRLERTKARRWRKPFVLYAATWGTTTFVGFVFYGGGSWLGAALFSVPLMIILTAHELGHFWQTRRYDIPASAPFFIPFPLPPFGTLGALIRMSGRVPNARALFDVGVSGPLAGLAATLVFLAVGLANSTLVDAEPAIGETLVFGEPLLFRWASYLFFDRSDPTRVLTMHPTAAAAWVGLFLTTLNLIPLGQLDGGHVLYALLRRRAVYFSTALFLAATGAVFFFERWNWLLMLFLIALFGVEHPPTADDSTRLGPLRTAIGWGTLALVAVGFTPNPIDVETPPPETESAAFSRIDETERAPSVRAGTASVDFRASNFERRAAGVDFFALGANFRPKAERGEKLERF